MNWLERFVAWWKRKHCHHPLLITVKGRVIRGNGHIVVYRTCPDCGKDFKNIVI